MRGGWAENTLPECQWCRAKQPYPISIQQAATLLHRAHLHSLRSVWIQPAFQLWNCTVSGVARVKLSRMFTLIGTGLLAAKRRKSALSPVHYREVWFYHARLVILEGLCHGYPKPLKWLASQGPAPWHGKHLRICPVNTIDFTAACFSEQLVILYYLPASSRLIMNHVWRGKKWWLRGRFSPSSHSSQSPN